MIDWYALPEFKPKFNERVLVVYSGGIFIGQLIQEDGNGLTSTIKKAQWRIDSPSSTLMKWKR